MKAVSKRKRSFGALQSEKNVEIVLLYKKVTGVFGSKEKINARIETENLALGKIKPKQLLDKTFDISLLKDELTRIEIGVLA